MSDPAPLDAAWWASSGASSWLQQADRLEAQLEPILEVLFAAAQLRPGEHVLDVGCGRAATTLRAASLVGRAGRVTGLDIATELIDAARALPAESSDSADTSWVVADAERHHFRTDTFDAVISRFGVMFFTDPIAAFANLRTACRPHGRLVVAVWQPRHRSTIQRLPFETARATASALGCELRGIADDAGPFACGVEAHTVGILGDAGWHDITFQPSTVALYVGGPGTTPAEAARVSISIGSLSTLVRDAPAEVVEAIAADLERAYEAAWDGTGIKLDAAIAMVTARP